LEITWLGHSSFRLKGKESSVIIDPCSPVFGYNTGKLQADIVTVSHDHPGHNCVEAVEVGSKVLNRPGEYEVRDILAISWNTWHDDQQGKERGRNLVFHFEIEGVRLLHLGDLGHVPSWEAMPEAGSTDVLFLPAGGLSTIPVNVAAQIMRHISPKIVIPMHYRTPVMKKSQLETLDKFLKETGSGEREPQPRLMINRSSMPLTGTQIVVLSYPQK
jgi:L-ascorbate metabolism protein UlaG (beta-lactamase superfamily)